MNRYALLISFALFQILIAASSCVKPCHESDHDFSIPESFIPEKDSLAVGDTLWVSSVISKQLVDTFTKQPFEFSNPNNLGSTLFVSDIRHFLDDQRGAVKDFNLINRAGRLFTVADAGPDRVLQISFDQQNDQYVLLGGLVARKSGLYIFTFSDANGVYRNDHPKCGLSNFTFTNANVNQHLNLFTDFTGYPFDEFTRTHSFCVKVY